MKVQLPMDVGKRNLGRAVIYFSRSVGKDITTAATLLVVCEGNDTLAIERGRYVSGQS